MKIDIPVPFERLAWFQGKLGLGPEELGEIFRHRDLFAPKKQEFAERLFLRFYEIRETRAILDHQRRKEDLKKVWSHWYGLLFQGSFTAEVLTYLWRSGLRHVEINLDKRFVNLAYSFVRQFFQEICSRAVAPAGHSRLMASFDKVVDFCVLIETHAYVTATAQCDMEVVKGISHQVRNPLTVIGGNILRLQRKAEPGGLLYKTYEAILAENRRLENMVRDAGIYSDLFQGEPNLSTVSLDELVSECLKELEGLPEMGIARIEVSLDPSRSCVQGDPAGMQTMFRHLLQNALEAMDPDDPLVRISSRGMGPEQAFVQIEIFNSGRPPDPEEIDQFFVPFYSTKPLGTGFGLPIAQVVARKCLGDIVIEPVPNQGTRCIVTLAAAPAPVGDAG
ncbi:MAG: ATP-binding protein [Thermodesulfobacteriota bacterium]